MKGAVIPGLLCVLLVSSCDKAREVAVKAKEAVSEGISQVVETKADPGVTDAALEELVDGGERGYLFRSDLPFPENLATTNHWELRMTGRMARSSIFGDEVSFVNGKVLKRENRYEKNGGRVEVEIGDLQGLEPPSDGEEVWKTVKPAGKAALVWRDGKWRAVPDGKAVDFSNAVDFPGDDFARNMVEEGLSPRPFWFGKGRLKTGDRLSLTGEQMKMLALGAEEGRIDILLESVEAVHGHPCGVFAVTGDYSGTHAFGKGDVTIESGKVWLSLLHPLVLKSEMEMVMTGRGDETKGRSMGSVRVRQEREWKAGG